MNDLQGDIPKNTEVAPPQNDTATPVELPQHLALGPVKSPRKSKQIRVITIIILILVFILFGMAVWIAVSSTSNGTAGEDAENGASSNNEDNGDEGSDTESSTGVQAPGGESTKLSADDELVRRLRGNFRDGSIYGTDLSNGLSDDLMMMYAAQNVAPIRCAISYTDALEKRYAKDIAAGFVNEYSISVDYMNNCYRSDDVLFKVKDMFGKTLALDEGLEFRISIFSNPYQYSVEYDEFYPAVFNGGGAAPSIISATFAAEKTDDHVFIYDIAGYDYGSQDVNGVSYGYAGPISPESECSFLSNSFIYEKPNCRIDYTLNSNTILDHMNDYTKYKWTFVWNGENYIFEKLEQE